MYKDENTDVILSVDASNAFSSLNRQLFLHNISYLCLSSAKLFKNCYSTSSKKCPTQGDPVSMVIYGFSRYVN